MKTFPDVEVPDVEVPDVKRRSHLLDNEDLHCGSIGMTIA